MLAADADLGDLTTLSIGATYQDLKIMVLGVGLTRILLRWHPH